MVKHNNVLPNQHFKKHWQERVRVYLDRPSKRIKRRLLRKQKAAALAPRPASGPLRPLVNCPTQRYNMRVRKGRGFTLLELKNAGINFRVAPTIGIAVDKRRKNLSQEGLDRNVQLLKNYMSRLIVFPRKQKVPKKGDSSKEECDKAVQLKGDIVDAKKFMAQKGTDVQKAEVTKELREANVAKEYRMQKAWRVKSEKAKFPQRIIE